jgi:hypothetical protein
MAVEQRVGRANVKGAVSQTSNVPDTKQFVDDVSAAKLNMRVGTEGNTLQLGSYKATGAFAVGSLLVVAIVYFVYRYAVS